MSTDPALTYAGALRILGRRERKWLERLDVLLGGVILAAGAASVITPPAAVTAFAAMWGWTEQKDEALKLVRAALDALPERLRGVGGLERRELILAAHSTLVVASYFEALQETLGRRKYKQLEIAEEEKLKLAASGARHLYETEVPSPSASFGFAENGERIKAWMFELDRRVRVFVSGLAVSESWEIRADGVVARGVKRYDSQFIRLAAAVPEFRVWAELSEHAATRSELATLNDELQSVLSGQTAALARLESVLLRATVLTGSPTVVDDQRTSVGRANRAALDEKIIPESAAHQYGSHLDFPTVRRMFVNPHYRLGLAAPESRLADEHWWAEQQSRDDLDLRLAAHLASTEATSLPLLILGHPGAGKSMLTRVLAARLPEASYTVVRVPLRHVGAHVPVYDQIQQALDRVTHHRVVWSELVEQSLGTVRVVILDGLDELLHQAHTRLYGYLRSVAEFQRNELAQNRPVVVIVTSRTVVMERVDIAPGTVVIKLEEFGDDQIAQWLDAWSDANSVNIDAGTARALPLEAAVEQRSLTSQPLLLMMMAIYVADPAAPMIDAGISSAEFYGRLLTHFAEREAAKSPVPLSPDELRDSVEDHLRRLSIAALGMFNRGRQDITAEDIGSDLATLEKQNVAVADPGYRVLGEFFFVYTAEARFLAPGAPDRRYEFLHATFGEYLVARRVIEELAEVARAAFSARRGVREPEDDLLFAMLSFETLSVRRPALTFAAELCAQLSETDREHMIEILDRLIAGHRDRHGSDKFLDYRPKKADRVRELAAYTANLILLRVAIHREKRLPLKEIFHDADDPYEPWRPMLSLWRAGLDGESWSSVLYYLRNDAGRLLLSGRSDGYYGFTSNYEFAEDEPNLFAALSGDRREVEVVRYGNAFVDGNISASPGDDWEDIHGPWLALALANWNPGGVKSMMILNQHVRSLNSIDDFVERLEMLLKIRSQDTILEQTEDFVRFILNHRGAGEADPVALAAAVLSHPELLRLVSELNEPNLFSTPGVALMFKAMKQRRLLGSLELEELTREVEERHLLGKVTDPTLLAVRELLDAHQWQMERYDDPISHFLVDRAKWEDEDES